MKLVSGLEDRLMREIESSPLPESPDRDRLEAWLVGSFFEAWRQGPDA